ncbi:hypothetical protein L9F63_008025 [Diploptera punctata]|uniref:Uncharacterized protein n=1 Tax=Diploptera punctata TaxID=6984 RepID=A0AAD7Z6T2_DIPPU|nr:hypothetical protein L9F63_008025 [Diploptera punctata]
MPDFNYDVGAINRTMRTQSSDKRILADFLIIKLFKKSNWPLLITQPKYNLMQLSFQQVFTYNECYLILTWPADDGNVLDNLIYQIQKLDEIKCLNTRARFILIVINEQTNPPSEIASCFLTTLLERFFIVDILVLVTGMHTSDSVKENILFYTWFPYHDSGKYPVFLDEIIFENSTSLIPDVDLFPQKFPNKLNAPPITASMFMSKPIVTLIDNYSDENGIDNFIFKGPEVDIFTTIMKQLNLSFNFIYSPDTSGDFVSTLIEAGMKVVTREADIVFEEYLVSWKLRKY